MEESNSPGKGSQIRADVVFFRIRTSYNVSVYVSEISHILGNSGGG